MTTTYVVRQKTCWAGRVLGNFAKPPPHFPEVKHFFNGLKLRTNPPYVRTMTRISNLPGPVLQPTAKPTAAIPILHIEVCVSDVDVAGDEENVRFS